MIKKAPCEHGARKWFPEKRAVGAAAMTDFSGTQGGWSNNPGAIKANLLGARVLSHATELADKNWGRF
jgi:hypothetical protein